MVPLIQEELAHFEQVWALEGILRWKGMVAMAKQLELFHSNYLDLFSYFRLVAFIILLQVNKVLPRLLFNLGPRAGWTPPPEVLKRSLGPLCCSFLA